MSSILLNNARDALERVCSGACANEAARYYAPTFVDHVNGAQFVGFKGIERSVIRYGRVFRNLTIEVIDQLIDDQRVVSRFRVTGVVLGRLVSFTGITISQFRNEVIVEDWSITDTGSLLRQLGGWRALYAIWRGM
jgi:predicted ester cyclase